MHRRASVLRDSLQTLTRLHEELDDDIRAETERDDPDKKRLQKLKRMRRRVEEQIEIMSPNETEAA